VRRVLALLLTVCCTGTAAAQSPRFHVEAVEVPLPDSTSVLLVPSPTSRSGDAVSYRYLPSRLRIAEDPDGRPSAFFYAYADEPSDSTRSGAQTPRVVGGTLHLLLDWSLSPADLQLTRQALARRCGATAVDSRDVDIAAPRTNAAASSEASILASVRGIDIIDGDITCGEIDGPFRRIADVDWAGNLRLHAGVNFDDSREPSTGHLDILPGQKMVAAIELEGPAASLLSSSRPGMRLRAPPGAWWLDLDLRIPARDAASTTRSDLTMSTSQRIAGWFRPFQVRRVRAVLADPDRLASDFGSLVDYVAVMFSHEDDAGTHSEASFFDGTAGTSERASFTYRLTGDDVHEALTYRYRVVWQFVGGGRFDSGWSETRNSTVHLEPPYRHVSVELVVDPDRLADEGARSVTVRLSKELFGAVREHTTTLPRDASMESQSIDLVVPADSHSYDYEIVWHLDAGKQRTFSGRSDVPLLFVDDPPDDTESR
jgi:hypothetical protein